MLKKYGLKQVAFILKEPMLYPDIIGAIKYCCTNNIETEIITNGTLIDENNVGELVESGITVINISIEGISNKTNDCIRGKGTLKKVVKSIKLLKKECENRKIFIPIVIKMTLNAFNTMEVQYMAEYFKDLGIAEVRFNAITLEGNAKNNVYLKLDKNSLMDCVDQILSSYSRIVNPQYTIEINSLCPSAYIFYNLKYKLNLMISYPSCISMHRTFSLDAGGTIYACSNNYTEIDGYGNKIYKIPNSDLLASKSITDFLKDNEKFHQESSKIYNMKEICPNCILNTKCQPCHLKEEEKVNEMIEECYFYQEQIKKLIKKETNLVIRLKKSAYILKEKNIYTCINTYPNGKSFGNNISNKKYQHIIDKIIFREYCYIKKLSDEKIEIILQLLLTDCFCLENEGGIHD